MIYTPNGNSIFHRTARLTHHLSGGTARFFMERVIIAMHTLYFTPGTLNKALTGSGFKVADISLTDIDLDFIFEVHSRFWWANPVFHLAARGLQRLSGFWGMNSHMLTIAEASE